MSSSFLPIASPLGTSTSPFKVIPLSWRSRSSIASLAFFALSFLNCFLSSLRNLVYSSLVSTAVTPSLFFSRSSQVGSLLLRLPLPKKPFSHRNLMVFSSVTCTERVSDDQYAWHRGSGCEGGCDSSWYRYVETNWMTLIGL